MKNQQQGLSPIFISLIVVAGLIIIGGGVTYFYNKNKPENVAKPDSTESANQPQEESDLAGFSNDHLQTNYLIAKLAIENKADLLFNKATTDRPEIKLKSVPANLRNEINDKRQKITELFNTWEKLIAQTSTTPNSTAPNLASISTQNLITINSYLANLSTIVNNLTPGNSGLTSAEIDHYQAVIADAQADIQDEVSSPETTDNDFPINQLPLGSSGKPRLVEGANRD